VKGGIQINSKNKQLPEMVDAELTESMVRNNIGWMIAVAQRLLSDRALAEDAVQDAFISAFRGFDKFDNRAQLKTWLHRITVNAALMKLRKIKRQSEQTIDDFLPKFDQYECRIEAQWTQLVSVENIVAREQSREQIHNAIDQLPDQYRNVLLLRDIEGYNTHDVAALLNISESNVKVRLHRARAALKKIIEPLLRDKEYK